MVGDRLSDIECGLNAGCRTVLLTHYKSSRRGTPDPDDEMARQKAHFIANNLREDVQWIIEVSSNDPTPKTHEME